MKLAQYQITHLRSRGNVDILIVVMMKERTSQSLNKSRYRWIQHINQENIVSMDLIGQYLTPR